MEELKKLWEKINGDKTIVGNAIIALAFVLSQSGIEAKWVDIVVQIGVAIGGSTTVVGLLHKMVKGLT